MRIVLAGLRPSPRWPSSRRRVPGGASPRSRPNTSGTRRPDRVGGSWHNVGISMSCRRATSSTVSPALEDQITALKANRQALDHADEASAPSTSSVRHIRPGRADGVRRLPPGSCDRGSGAAFSPGPAIVRRSRLEDPTPSWRQTASAVRRTSLPASDRSAHRHERWARRADSASGLRSRDRCTSPANSLGRARAP